MGMMLMNIKIFQKGFNYSQDGTGNRLVYHLQGCNMRCPWCSNPESFNENGTLMIYNSCKEYTIESIADEVDQCSALFYDGGGITLTGGEPTRQYAVVDILLKHLKMKGIHTAIETNATHPELEKLFPYIDLLIMDFKHYDNDIHTNVTGVGNTIIKENIKKAFKLHKNVLLRIPLVKGFNSSLNDIKHFIAFFREYDTQNVSFELLPYHEYGKIKWKQCGMTYRLDDAFVESEMIPVYEKLFKENNLSIIRT
jgi:pyruvate formate lyase activating enzyme